MWKMVTSAAALTFTLMNTAYAEVVSFPQEILPLKVNDKTIEHSFFQPVDELELAPGSYRLQLKYSDLYDTGFDDHEVIESEPFWVTLDVAAGQNYELVFDRARSAAAAKLFAQSPVVRLRANGQSLAATMPSAAPVAASNSETAAPAVKPVSASVSAAPKAVSVAPATQGISAASMLEFWWQQATPAERQAFLRKVQSQQ